MQLTQILIDAFSFYTRHILQIAALCLPLLCINAYVASLLMRSPNLQSLSYVSYFTLYPIYTAALILLMAKRARQEQPRNMDLIAAALKLWWPLFVLTAMNLGLVLLGAMLFIIPGLWVAVRLAFAEFFLVLNDMQPKEAIRHSFKLTKRYFWPILFLLMAVALCHGMFGYVIDQTMMDVKGIAVVRIAIESLLSFLMLFFDVVLFRLFMVAAVENPLR
jgi:membrane-anchored glycerophosphoryl diester phosphodiesterase (GDPDase)